MTPAVLLEDPKHSHNLGAIVRACACFGIPNLYWTGSRIDLRGTGRKGRLPREERLACYRSVAWENLDGPDPLPVGLSQMGSLRPGALADVADGRTPIAVEARSDFQSLVWFEHPADALYLFGPEDGTLSGQFTSLAHAHLVIPSRFCTNLAAAVYIVLYDRTAKMVRSGEPPFSFLGRGDKRQ